MIEFDIKLSMYKVMKGFVFLLKIIVLVLLVVILKVENMWWVFIIMFKFWRNGVLVYLILINKIIFFIDK